MISPEEFLAYLTKIDGGCVSVDLFKIASGGGGGKQTQSGKNAPGGGGAIGTAAGKAAIGKLRLALDMEDCLDRFYGGYYSGNCEKTDEKQEPLNYPSIFRLGLRRPVEPCL